MYRSYGQKYGRKRWRNESMTADMDKQGMDVLREVQVKVKWRTLVFPTLGFINDFHQDKNLTEGQKYHVVWKEVSKEKDGKVNMFKNLVSIEPDARSSQEGHKDAAQSVQKPLVDYHAQKTEDITKSICLKAAGDHMSRQMAFDAVRLVKNAKELYEECKKQEFP